MNTQSKLITLKSNVKGYKYEYVYIYFRHDNQTIRVNTGNLFIDGKMTKELLYTTTVLNYATLNAATKELKNRVDNYILECLNNQMAISQKDCKEFIKDSKYVKTNIHFSNEYNHKNKSQFIRLPEKLTIIQPLTELTLIQLHKQFFDYKQKELAGRTGIKDHKAVHNALEDYEKFNKVTLTLDSVNSKEFLFDFRNFLMADRTKHKKNYHSVGGLNDNTINKRISVLKQFFKYIELNELYTFKREVMAFIAPKYDTEVVALSKDEIRELMSIETTNTTHQKIIDSFVMNCFFGLRHSDLYRLTPANFTANEEGEYTLTNENKKTGVTVTIPVLSTALSILEKYNFTVPVYTNQYYNRELKKIL